MITALSSYKALFLKLFCVFNVAMDLYITLHIPTVYITHLTRKFQPFIPLSQSDQEHFEVHFSILNG